MRDTDRDESGTERINYVIVGIGINVNLTEDDFSDDLKGIATSF